MSTLEKAFAEFTDAWVAGRRPDVDDYLARVPEQERDALAQQIEVWLTFAPAPAYDEAALAAIRAEPALQGALAAALIADAREDASLSVDELAGAVAEAVGLAPAQREKTGRMLGALEAGRLDLGRLSQRLVDALGRILRLPAGALAPPAGAAGALAFRAESEDSAAAADDFELLRRGAAAPSARDWDEVDELFLGGR